MSLESDNPLAYDDALAEVANGLHTRDLVRAGAEFEAYHRQWKAKADKAREERDKWNKHEGGSETKLWYKFHGQHQAYDSVAKHYAKAAAGVYSRIADGEKVL